MAQNILSLFDAGDQAKLGAALDELSDQELNNLISTRALKGRGDVNDLVRAVLFGSPCTSTDGVSRRLVIFKCCIELLQTKELHSKVASELVGILMLETDSFPGQSLTELAGIFVDAVKNGNASGGKSLELFPKILSALATKEAVGYGDGEISGQEYKSHVLNTLCSCRWDPRTVTTLAAIFRDIPMTDDELKFVISKILKVFKDLEYEEIPPLVYQLLLLSTKGHKRLVLEGISSFFIAQDKKVTQLDEGESELTVVDDNSDLLRQTQGNIILHITFAIKQDQELGREFIKYLKNGQQCSPAQVLAPFNVALALSISKIHRFEEQVFDFLKASVLKSFKDSEKQQQSFWIKNTVPETCDVEELVLQTVKHSKYGWDHVTQGLVQLGFILMDSFGPKAVFGKVEVTSSAVVTPGQQACDLGAKILMDTFKAHEMVRGEILEQILNRVVTKATSPVSHYIDLLASTVKSSPQILLESLPRVREAFDYLSFLPAASADGLLKAVQPLMKISMNLKDTLLLVLRKAMFSRQLDARKIAVGGFLLILKHFRVLGGMSASQISQPFSSSQVQVDIHTSYNPASNEGLCLEILGNLRKALSQQADVKLLLYEGLFDVLCRNSQLQNPIMDMLMSQFKRYYEATEDVNPPLKLDPCITPHDDKFIEAEPLSQLLSCIVQCCLHINSLNENSCNTQNGHQEVLGDLEDILGSLTRRMIKSEMEDFELDKSADFSRATSVGDKNNKLAVLVLGVYEVLIEYNFSVGDYSESSFQDILQLHINYQKLSDVVREKGGGGSAGKKSRPVKPATSLMSLRAVHDIVKALFSDETPSHQASLATLRDNSNFCHYIVGVALQKLQQISERGFCDGPEGQDKVKVFKHMVGISSVLLDKYCTYLEKSGQRERNKQLAAQCLEGFSITVDIVCTRYKNRLSEFLTDLDGNQDKSDETQDESDNGRVYKYIKKFQRLVMTIISSDDDDHVVKETIPLLNIINCLSKQLSEVDQLTRLQSWIQRLCQEQNIEDTNTVKVLLGLMFNVASLVQNVVPLMLELAQDVHSQQGDVDQEVEVEDRTNFAIVTPRTSAPCVPLFILQQSDRELDHTEWVLNRLKADLLTSTASCSDAVSPPALTQREGQEKGVCTRLGMFVNTFHELVQSALPAGPCIEHTLKQLTKLYNTLTSLVKYYIALYNQKAGHLSARFEKLVKLSGTHLTQQVYAFITYIQALQADQVQATGNKKSNKKKTDTSALAGKFLKDSKFVPNLIFAIEQYERFLIQLSKKSKVNLMEFMKLSTSRDFRINTNTVVAVLEQQSDTSSDEEEEENEENKGDQENQTPNAKRAAEPEEEATPASKKRKIGGKLKAKKTKVVAE